MTSLLSLLSGSRAVQIGLAFLAVCAILALLIHFVDAGIDRATTAARDAGAAEERAVAATTATIRTEKAHAAAETVRRDPAARDAECLRHARNPDDC